jgi:hypothetical protein
LPDFAFALDGLESGSDVFLKSRLASYFSKALRALAVAFALGRVAATTMINWPYGGV